MIPSQKIIQEEKGEEWTLEEVYHFASYPGMKVMEELEVNNPEEVYEAKQRISQKLHKAGEEDADVELIINHMFDICRIVSTKMFEYGAITA